MRCDKCGSEMLALLFSSVCDTCDRPTEPSLYRGCVWDRQRAPGSCEYVFRYPEHATRWAQLAGVRGRVRSVLCATPFAWVFSAGADKTLERAVGLFEVHSSKPPPEGERTRRVWWGEP